MSEDLEQQFLQLLKENQQRINRICSIYANNKEDQKDLMQEVIFNIWKALPSYQQTSSINTWVYRIILNVCLKKTYRKTKPTISLDNLTFEPSIEATQSSPKLEALRSCIAKLAFSDRSIIVLYLEELSYREIGDLVGISENYVAVKLKRIKKKLANCLETVLNE